MAERIEYDEFAYFHENADEYGIDQPHPPVVRREPVELPDGRRISTLVWGSEPPEVVLVHGGAQNAHTWDTVALALGRPLLAVDLPGHGHSDAPAAGATDPFSLAADVAVAVRRLAPSARGVVGMSLGGLTTLALTTLATEVVPRMVLVDITPGVNAEKSAAITAFVNGPRTFPSFEEILARTIEHNPTRTVASLRRGILHNAVQLEDGSWMWRYRRHADAVGEADRPVRRDEDLARLWQALADYPGPSLLVRGMRPQSVVDDADEDRYLETATEGTVVRVEEAGHSVQGDTPVELAEILRDFLDLGPRVS